MAQGLLIYIRDKLRLVTFIAILGSRKALPEGPTIKNMAERLSTALVGQVITKVSSRYKKAGIEDWPSILQGRTIERVRSHGKNLFIDLSGGCTIYSHMVMWGSWHLYEL